jgi:hypothetical protein
MPTTLFALANVPGDWSWLNTKTVDMGPYFRRRGMIFVNGRPLEPVEQFRELVEPLSRTSAPDQSPPRSGLPPRSRGGPIVQEIGGTPDGRFWIEPPGTAVHIRIPEGDPSGASIEVTTREQASHPPRQAWASFASRGSPFNTRVMHFPPPQRGLVSTNGGNHWIIEGNTIEWASGMGLDIAGQEVELGASAAGGRLAHHSRQYDSLCRRRRAWAAWGRRTRWSKTIS